MVASIAFTSLKAAWYEELLLLRADQTSLLQSYLPLRLPVSIGKGLAAERHTQMCSVCINCHPSTPWASCLCVWWICWCSGPDASSFIIRNLAAKKLAVARWWETISKRIKYSPSSQRFLAAFWIGQKRDAPALLVDESHVWYKRKRQYKSTGSVTLRRTPSNRLSSLSAWLIWP